MGRLAWRPALGRSLIDLFPIAALHEPRAEALAHRVPEPNICALAQIGSPSVTQPVSDQTRTATLSTVAVLAGDLRSRRRELGLTQQELADLAEVSTRFIHDLENSKPTVQLDRVLAVTHALGLNLRLQVRQPAVGGTTRP